MKLPLHVIGVSLSLLLVVLAAQEPPLLSGTASASPYEARLLAELQAVRRERAIIGASWDRTVAELQQSALRLDAPKVIVVRDTPRRPVSFQRPVAARLPAAGVRPVEAARKPEPAGVWSAVEEAARQERREWIDAEMRKRGTE